MQDLNAILQIKKGCFLDFENSFKDAPFNTYLKTTKGILLECNDTQAKTVGAGSRKDIIGSVAADLISVKAAEIINSNDREVIKGEKAKFFLEQGTLINKSPYFTFSFKMPIQNNFGKVIALFGISILFDEMANINQFDLVSSTMEQLAGADILKNMTKREKECLYFLKLGMSSKEIARELRLSPRTIEFYIENMKKKLGCVKRTELIVKAMSISRDLSKFIFI